jgi:dUTP pyrophosphatase
MPESKNPKDNQVLLKVKKLDPRAILPTRNNETDAGLDLYSIETKRLYGITAQHYDVIAVRTGIAIQLPIGTAGLIWPRSGLGRKGVIVLGGVIDEGYRGEIVVLLASLGFEDILIEERMKVAQMIVQPVRYVVPELVSELSESNRGIKGFGSSGA